MHRLSLLPALALAFAMIAFAPVAEAKDKHCPPGLAKKDPPCVPPGLAKKQGEGKKTDRDDDDKREVTRDTTDDTRRLRRLLRDADDLTRAERRELRRLWEEADRETRRRLMSRLDDAERREVLRVLGVETVERWRFDDERRDLLFLGERVYETGDLLPEGSFVVIDGDQLRLYPALPTNRRYVQLNNDVVAVVDAGGSFIRALRALGN